jgi:hypothetical protein
MRVSMVVVNGPVRVEEPVVVEDESRGCTDTITETALAAHDTPTSRLAAINSDPAAMHWRAEHRSKQT